MLLKLSLRNVKKSIKDYIIYFFTLLFSVIIFYLFNMICETSNFMSLTDGKKDVFKLLSLSIKYVSFLVIMILGFLIIYANKFFIKRRSKEFAIYITLGMSKKKMALIIAIETITIGFLTLFLGTFLGFLLSHILLFLTSNIFKAQITTKIVPFFSKTFLKTITNFLIIFSLSLFLNIFIISKTNIINLLNVSKKRSKERDKLFLYTGFITLIYLSLYNLNTLLNGNLLNLSKPRIIVMFIFLLIQTFLFFYTFFHFIYLFLKKKKHFYYSGTNLFLVSEMHKSSLENVFMNTFIAIIFFLTMVMLSFSLSFCYIFNHNFNDNNRTDFSVVLKNTDNYEEKIKKVSKSYVTYSLYEDNLNFTDLLSKKALKKVFKESQESTFKNDKILLIKASSYNKLMALYGLKKVTLKDENYAVLSNVKKANYNISLSDNKKVNINGTILKPQVKKVINVPMFNFSVPSNNGVVVLPDKLLKKSNKVLKVIVGNYKKGGNDKKLLSLFKSNNVTIYTKKQMQNVSFGVGVIATYISLYLGITFLMSSSFIISVKELSATTDMASRYKTLKLFTTSNETLKLLFKKLLITFLSPFFVSFIYALIVINKINMFLDAYETKGNINSIIFAFLFVFVIYSFYFLLTFKMCKRILKKY